MYESFWTDKKLMKIILSLLFIVPGLSFAVTCDELQLNLLNLESKILNSKVRECTDINDTYCRYDNVYNLSYSEVQKNYNKAIADLVIHKGIAAITSSLQGNHNSIADIKTEQLEKAQKYVATLEESVTKAEILEAATVPVKKDGETVSFWFKNGYHPDISYEQFKAQLTTDCAQETEAICSKKEHFSNEDYMQTIYGFTKAELRSRTINSSDPSSFYSDINKQLKITIKDKDKTATTVTPSQYRDLYLGKDGRINTFKTALANFEQEQNPELKRTYKNQIIDIAKEIDNVSTTYGVNSNPNNDDKQSVSAILAANFQKPFKDLETNLTDNFINDTSKKNFEQNISVIKGDNNALKAGLELEIGRLLSAEFGEDTRDTKCEASETYAECFDLVCKKKNSCSFAGRVNQQRNNIKRHEELEKDFDNAFACYRKSTPEEKRSCLEKIAKKLNPEYKKTTKAELENKVRLAKKELENYNRAEPLLSLGEEKLLAIAALETHPNNCLEDLSVISNNCFQSSDISPLNGGTLKIFSKDLGDISIRLNQSAFDKARGRSQGSEQALSQNESQSEFLKQCSSGDKTGDLCSFYQDEEQRKAKFVEDAKQQTRARELTQKRSPRNSGQTNRSSNQRNTGRLSQVNTNTQRRQEVKSPSAWDNIFGGIGRGLTQPNPVSGRTALGDLINGGLGYASTLQTTSIQRDQIAFSAAQFDARVQFLRDIQPPYSDVTLLSNGTFGPRTYLHNGVVLDSNFEALTADSGLLFQNSNALNALPFSAQTTLFSDVSNFSTTSNSFTIPDLTSTTTTTSTGNSFSFGQSI